VTPEEFREHGHQVVDWIATYQSTVDEYPVLSPVAPGWVRAQLPATAPEQPEPFTDVMADLDRIIMPGITHWQHPSWFAYFPANTSGPSILGELVAAGLGVQGMLWQTSPAATELETHVLDWMVDLLGLPSAFRSDNTGGGVIQDSASSAALCALLAARERASQGRTNTGGVRAPLTAYATAQAHSSIEKAVRIAGLGSSNLRAVATRDDLSMSPEALEAAIRADLDAGNVPCFVTATVGTTGTNAMDPLPAIADICTRYGVWLHVDAAMSGSAAICPEFRHLQQGLDGADSYCMNPHKWLLTNFDCDLFYVRDRSALISALSILPEYLRNQASASGAVIDYRDWQVPLGRRFRSLKLWFVLRSYGAEQRRAMVRRHVDAAQWFAAMLDKSTEFTMAAPAPLNLVCFSHTAGDQATQHVLDTVNATGQAYLTHAKVHDRLVIRLSVGQEKTTQEHVEAVWAQLLDAAQHLPAFEPVPVPDSSDEVTVSAADIRAAVGPPAQVTSIVEPIEPTGTLPTPSRRAGPTLSRVLIATVLAILNVAGIAVGGSLLALVLTDRLASDVDGPRIVLLYALLSAGVAVIGAGIAAIAVARRWVGGWWFTVPVVLVASACYAVWTVAPVVWPTTF
jgi:aromatic-L-amino-acid decarboxylase